MLFTLKSHAKKKTRVFPNFFQKKKQKNNLYLNYEDLELILNKLLKDEKHQTRVSLLLELVSDVYLTVNRTRPVVFHTGYYTTRPQNIGRL